MKKIYVLSLILLIMVFVSSCKKNEKKEVNPTEKAYSVITDSTKINS